MKKIILIVIALVAIQVSAQDRRDNSNQERGARMSKFQDLTPEEMATLQTKKMTLHLDLNESQQREIQKINLENATQRKAKMETRKAQKGAGNMQKPSKEERLKMMNERLDHQIEMKGKMKKILNADQYAKWEKSQGKIEGRRKNMSKQNGMKKNKN